MANPYPIDHYVSIVLEEDKLKAYVQFTNIDEQFTLTKEELLSVLKAHHIVYGIRHEALTEIVEKLPEYLYKRTLIAEGDRPRDGADGWIQMAEGVYHEEKGGPGKQEDGKVDFKQVRQINNVRKGELIATRVSAEEGKAGRSVTGEELFAKNGKEAFFKMGKNVVADEENKRLFAVIDGVVSKTDGDKINVFPVYEVNGDIDYSVGNIDFVGTVVIRGNVLTGFRVKASGDIRIIGGVEGAEIEAGGSIEVTAGIMGHNKGYVQAGKSIKCSFVQDANLSAAEDILVSQSIMHAQVKAGKNVVCQGSKGLIVGGVVQAGETVNARTIGNSTSTPTVLEVGVLPELRNELLQLRNETRAIKENLDKTEKALGLLDTMALQGQLSSDKLAMRIKLNNTKKQAQLDLQAKKERMLEIEHSLEDTENAKVIVTGTIFNGSKVVIGRYTRFVKETYSRVVFRLSEGDISIVNL
ncbi:hypothetical protein XYCOK13_14410 [Xylanibacillus composti]|uniref:Flagellar Assembly Protein A N-terminal region domain-containing protein n=1 Tax=Xylanibacillus composti TaxID=1572762 RepID=A0A8J4M270_9BACL|nr:FapA family protein [Xylanibacillus composti]GIQ68617.1 hypothetical protein XYCOK13_14410 [Xylanibacillus composti]